MVIFEPPLGRQQFGGIGVYWFAEPQTGLPRISTFLLFCISIHSRPSSCLLSWLCPVSQRPSWKVAMSSAHHSQTDFQGLSQPRNTWRIRRYFLLLLYFPRGCHSRWISVFHVAQLFVFLNTLPSWCKADDWLVCCAEINRPYFPEQWKVLLLLWYKTVTNNNAYTLFIIWFYQYIFIDLSRVQVLLDRSP